ncbi:MAG: NIPSNAP family protein, partial [Rhodospirillaceae bacterium]|nr:NIPSNAP family protein [Rhodospirillaceae bacterium]
KRFEEAYEKRKEFSELAAFFYTEIGPLNQIIHIWPYEDVNQRQEIRAEAVKSGVWPPNIAEFIQHQHVEIMMPWSFSPELTPGNHGPFYEMRSYICKPGSIPATQERWQTKLEERTKMSPLGAVFSVDIGTALKIVHLWPYQDLKQRSDVRGEAAEKGIWPPKGGGPGFFSQENKILLPASFSPMQ